MKDKNAEIPTNLKISRGNFLRLAFGTAVATPFALKVLERAFYEAIILGIKNPDANDKAVSAALEVSKKAPKSENPNFRPMADILKEGISAYSKGTKKPAFFRRIKDYKDVDYYADVIRDYSSSSLLPQLPDKLVDRLAGNLPRGAFESFFQSQYAITSFEQLFTSGSGFESRFRTTHPELVHKSGLYINSDQVTKTMAQEGRLEIDELKLKIEEKSKDTGQSVSASFVLAYFLEKNGGDISPSLFDTAIFLKFMARNNPNTGEFSADEANVQWYTQNIKDEYKGPTYMFPPEGELVINLIGKPYHSWNLVAMLQFIPVEVVRIGGIQKQLSTFQEQGLGKTRADLQTLGDLREIEQLLLSFSGESER